MARPTRTAWPLLIYRQNAGYETQDVMKLIQTSNTTINRIERGMVVRRVVAAQYLRLFNIDLNDPATIPPNMIIHNHGDRVAIEMREE